MSKFISPLAEKPKVHDLKCEFSAFNDLLDGRKTFEYRRNDRNFQVGDELYEHRLEPDGKPSEGGRTDRLRLRVTYILRGPDFGVPKGFVVMSVVRAP